MPIRSRLFKSKNRAFPALGRGCIVTLAAVSIMTAKLADSTTWSTASSVVSSTEIANRTYKGDRLPLSRLERADRELPIGCESVVSAAIRSPLTHVARDCLS
jgi:hypothetical protein